MKPIDLSASRAQQAIEFNPPVRGRDLIAAVKSSTGWSDETETYAEIQGNAHFVGQVSTFSASRNLAVLVPAGDEGYTGIEPDKVYENAVVARYHLSDRAYNAVREPRGADADAVALLARLVQREAQENHAIAVGLDRDRTSGGAWVGPALTGSDGQRPDHRQGPDRGSRQSGPASGRG
ncbi:hypothetical protein OHA18_30575 [Kribbella sp. NBC_00709]|uniref:hypothetical protein n=1 Tax=Kribbella sp. NBC_00709 TaxID=2975972 RepID=UPI002E296C9D|nr:hypothetical protein [Kribbella sp. NBC_00709]